MLSVGKVGFLGGGKMAQAMMKGLINAGLVEAKSIVASVHPQDLPNIKCVKDLGAEAVVENLPVVKQSDVVFITVKPDVVPQALSEVKSASANKLFLSIAMGITVADLRKNLHENSRIIRIMSNIPITVQAGCSAFVRGSNVTDEDAKLTQQLLKSVGHCEEVNEKLLDVITALAGSGPAFIFVLIESLADGAVKMGMPRDVAYRFASQTVLGAAQMVRDSKEHPGKLKDDVTSPGGSTAAGLNYLDKMNFRAAAAGAVEMATLRSKGIIS
ncbi:pyrroline-5-carboxylate reductase 2 isoform X1 [Hermetia illucens]|uniref:pyrroline-5-carboxylate reductase 2 isoform X1 n=2 Tax=Hermetia illucens TaxID=343691 RepID=UPI0018CC0066|nr:pyrroline-5-carboxylate reductase 2 isoform X1 [Hermetia illucens]